MLARRLALAAFATVCACAILAPVPPAAAQSLAPLASAPADTVYVVRRGDTLYAIGRRYGLTVAELQAMNALASADLRIGQRLRVAPETAAASAPPASPPPGEGAYVVEAGDTAYSLALRFGIPVDSVLTLAGGRVAPLEPGQRLALGDAAPPEPSADAAPRLVTHVVRRGDTLYSIARANGTSVAAILQASGLASDRLVPGQKLVVPQGSEASSAEATAAAPAAPRLPPVLERGPVVRYPDTFRGRLTASRALYDPARYTASHRTLALGTIVLLTREDTGTSTFAEVNDRGPLSAEHVMDVSDAVAAHLALADTVATEITVRVIREPAER